MHHVVLMRSWSFSSVMRGGHRPAGILLAVPQLPPLERSSDTPVVTDVCFVTMLVVLCNSAVPAPFAHLVALESYGSAPHSSACDFFFLLCRLARQIF